MIRLVPANRSPSTAPFPLAFHLPSHQSSPLPSAGFLGRVLWHVSGGMRWQVSGPGWGVGGSAFLFCSGGGWFARPKWAKWGPKAWGCVASHTRYGLHSAESISGWLATQSGGEGLHMCSMQIDKHRREIAPPQSVQRCAPLESPPGPDDNTRTSSR